MEDWQQWQIRADEIATGLSEEVDALEREFFSDESADPSFRAFWPRFRDLKERVRTAPAIKLEPKLELERRLRTLGSRAYKAQEGAYARSGERKGEILPAIQTLRSSAESMTSPRDLRTLRRELDKIRAQFDAESGLVPADRQALWDSWREANQFVWQRLTGIWGENEQFLRDFLDRARTQISEGNGGAARQSIGKFFESLRTHEAKQEVMNALKTEAEGLRREAEQSEERRPRDRERPSTPSAPAASPVESWRSELERNRELAARISGEVEDLDRQFRESGSILDQAMIRGPLVDKRRKLAELERANRTLEQRIEQSEEAPLISAG